jgi:cell shape-determining protein MreD
MKLSTLHKRWISAISLILHALLLIIVYVLQGMIFPYMRFSGLVPLLLPIVSTGVAIYQGRIAGGVAGIFAGILCDITFNKPAGVFTVLLTLTGLLIGILFDTVMARGIATYYISCAVVLAVSAFAQMFPLLFFENAPAAPLIAMAVRQTIYSLIFAFPIWFFVRALDKRAQRVSPSGRVI